MPPKTTKTDAAAAPAVDPRRALTLDQVLGNDEIRAFLRRAWREGRLPQVLLLTGPAGIGKTTLAWALAREIAAEDEDPATSRRSLKIARGVHPDVLELTPVGASGQITVKQIRGSADDGGGDDGEAKSAGLEDFAWLPPIESPRRFVMIEPADRMNPHAANFLLKILEEPPRAMLFLLITPEPSRLLPTIRSRCSELRLEPVELEPLAAWLRERTSLGVERARLIAALAEGRPGRALALAQTRLLESRTQILDAIAALQQEGFAAVFRSAELLLAFKDDPAGALSAATTLLRDALVARVRGEASRARLLNEDLAEPLTELAARSSAEGLLAAAELFEGAAAELPYFYSPQSRAHFIECLVIEAGRRLRLGA